MTDRLIYAALVAVWMAYLIPMGIRRYREVSAQGSIESFSSTMLALGRRPSASGASSTAAGGTPPGQTVAARPAQGQPAASGVLDRPSARQAAARRRRTLLILLGLVAVTGVLVVLTPLLWPLVLVPIALVVAFLVICHIQVARLEEAAWRRAAAEAKRSALSTRAAAPVTFGGNEEDTLVISGAAAARLASVMTEVAPSGGSRPSVVAHGATAASAPRQQPVALAPHGARPAPLQPQPAVATVAHGSSPSPAAEMQPARFTNGASPAPVLEPVASAASRASVEAVSGAHPASAPSEQPVAPATWDLRPVTLPTYITKSRAPHSVRSVDRTGLGNRSSGRIEPARTVREEPADKPVQQRRAVGG